MLAEIFQVFLYIYIIHNISSSIAFLYFHRNIILIVSLHNFHSIEDNDDMLRN